MPSYTRGVLRDNFVFVRLTQGQAVYYGFTTKDFGALPNVTAGELNSNLGHLTAVPTGAVVFVRSTSPKPPRVRKVIQANPGVNQQESVSTFCDPSKLNDALNAGWQLAKRGNSISIANNARTVGAGALLSNDAIVITPINKADFDSYGGELGLLAPASIGVTERERCVFGASRPKAGIAKKQLTGTGSVTKPFSTATNVLTSGWQILQDELI